MDVVSGGHPQGGQIHGEGRIRTSAGETLRVLWPFFRSRCSEQAWSVLPVVVYLFLFQILVLRWPIGSAGAISLAVAWVILGLFFLMEGLRLWLFPVGEAIGDGLPRKASMSAILGFAFLVGILATLAEPAMGALRAAGVGIDPSRAPLLHLLLNGWRVPLAAAVGIAVGVSVVLSMLRFLGNWPLKNLLVPIVLLLLGLTAWASTIPALASVIGLAWDFGAVVVGPITVPLVLGLGAGVCSASGRSDTGHSGFGSVTMISLFPILATLVLAFAVHFLGVVPDQRLPLQPGGAQGYVAALLHAAPIRGIVTASQAILPLSLLLFAAQTLLLRDRIARGDEVVLGLVFALAGLILFNLGILQGLTPLGDQVGTMAPGAFSTIHAGSPSRPFGPLYGSLWGKGLVVAFALILGYGATLAEPGLRAMGIQVQEITVGAFPRDTLMHAVAVGVGAGMALGVARIIFNLPLAWMVIPTYLLLLVLTVISSEEFVSIAWDSGASTTGPFTVPLVVAIGLGLTASMSGAAEGLGILALASAGPIVTVLGLGLLRRRPAARWPAGSTT
jgi:hypothetical protein